MKNENGFCSPRRRAGIIAMVAGVVWLCSGAGEAYGQLPYDACRGAGVVQLDANGNSLRASDAANPALIPCKYDRFQRGKFTVGPIPGSDIRIDFYEVNADALRGCAGSGLPWCNVFAHEANVQVKRAIAYIPNCWDAVGLCFPQILFDVMHLAAHANFSRGPQRCDYDATFSSSSSVQQLIVNNQAVYPGTASETYNIGGFGIDNFFTLKTNVEITNFDSVTRRALQFEMGGQPFLAFGEAIAGIEQAYNCGG